MIRIITISSDLLTEFKDIHGKILPKKREKHFQSYGIMNRSSKYADKDVSTYTTIEPIRKLMIGMLEDYTKDMEQVDSSNYLIEFHQTNCFEYKNKTQSYFEWHTDDEAPVSFKVYTVIIYLRKDPTVRGGNFEYKIDGINHVHNVNAGDCLIFRGDMYHNPQPSWGFGCRDAIVGFIKRLEPEP